MGDENIPYVPLNGQLSGFAAADKLERQ